MTSAGEVGTVLIEANKPDGNPLDLRRPDCLPVHEAFGPRQLTQEYGAHIETGIETNSARDLLPIAENEYCNHEACRKNPKSSRG